MPTPLGERALVKLDERVTPAQVSDSLDVSGYRHCVLDADIRPLVPGMQMVGRARTVQFAPVAPVARREAASGPMPERSVVDDGGHPYTEMIDLIDSIEAGEIVVIATGRSVLSAFWGELFSAAAKARGANGVVCDGYTRDRDKVLAVGFPVFCAGLRPIDYRARMRVVSTQQPVECAGVRIAPGDVVVAGDDGVVVVPSAAETEVLAAAQARATAESHVLAALVGGASLAEVWARYGVL